MENRFIKFLKANAIIIGPSTGVLLVLVGFLLFGLSETDTSRAVIEKSVMEQQSLQEAQFMELYNLGAYSEQNPFFVLDPFDVSPLTGLIMFETSENTQYEVVVKGKTIEGDLSFVSQLTTMHYIPVYGLYPNMSNVIEMYSYDEMGNRSLLATLNVQTEPVPEDVTLPTTIDTTHSYFGNDLMLMVPALKSLPVAFDYNGNVRWYLTENYSWSPKILNNGRLLLGTNRLVSDPYYVTGLYEMDFLGKVYKEYKIPGGYHHDVVELPNGNFLVLTDDFEGTVEDKIVEIDRTTGNVVDQWDLETYGFVLEGMSENYTTFDWFHNNSVDYDPISDAILLSGRHQDIVISIGKTSKELNYIIGDPENWSGAFSQYFFTPIGDEFEWSYAQHSARYLPDGSIFLFDNGNNKSKLSENYVDAADSYSRGVIYNVNETDMTIEQVYQFGKELGSSFYSPYISNIEYYEDGHYLIHSGGHGSLDGEILNIPGPLTEDPSLVDYKSMTYEVKDGVVKYYIEIPDNYYQAKRITLYSEYTVFRTGLGEVLGELDETETYSGSYDVKFSLLDTVPPKYEIELVKESDRLRVDIKLDKDDLVYLILQDGDLKLTYHVPTSRTAYTAMCTSTFQGDERYITYYINETNITGDFDVYIVINGREYHTYKDVEFN